MPFFPFSERLVIDVRDLRKMYGPLVAVDGISFTVDPGETLGLLGPNGAGKTTTMLMLTGALSPNGGEICLHGERDPTLPSVRRQLGFAPQALALYGELTAEENLTFFGRLYGLKGSSLAKRVGWALDFAGLADRRRDRVTTYSGGMQRRLNLVCALMHDPPIVLLDEPTAGVDPQSRNHLFDRVEELAELGRTILYTTHYMEEAERLCDRIAIVDHGKLLALDTPEALIRAHGGNSTVEAELAEAPPDSSRWPGKLDGKTLRFEAADPLLDVMRLAQQGLRVQALRVDRPNLETVFLNLTGHRLRDA